MRVFSYWSGPVGWMPRLTIASAAATGHDVTVFSYHPAALRSELPDVRIEDAREVLDDPTLTEMNARIPDHFSDHFRVEGLAKGLGVWADLDVVFLGPIGSQEYVLGADNGEICGAVLKLPARSAMLDDYLAMCRHRPVRYLMPWWTPRKKALMIWKRIEKKLRGKPPPRLQYGPPMLTYLTHKHQMHNAVARQDVYFPVPCSKSNVAAFGDGHRVEEFLTPNSRTVHLWSQYYQKVLGSDRPQADTWLGRKCAELAI